MNRPANCHVRVISEIIRDGEAERIGLDCGGEYLYSPEKAVISYIETTEYGPIQNTVTVTKEAACERVSVRRGDALHMELVCGEKRTGEYILPFGAIDMEYIAEELGISLDEDGGRIEMLYRMDIGGAESENRVVIVIEVPRVCG